MTPNDQTSANLGLYGVPLTISGAAYEGEPQNDLHVSSSPAQPKQIVQIKVLVLGCLRIVTINYIDSERNCIYN